MRLSVRGFRIVELLIVIVVIAILAAISVVAYNGIQDRANTSIVNSDLATTAKKLQLYKVDNGQFPLADSTIMGNLDIRISKASYDETINVQNLYYCRSNVSDQYTLVVRTKTDAKFYYDSASASIKAYTSGSWGSTNICTQSGLSDASVLLGHDGNGWRTWVK